MLKVDNYFNKFSKEFINSFNQEINKFISEHYKELEKENKKLEKDNLFIRRQFKNLLERYKKNT